MLLTEYNEAKTMALFKEEGRVEGREQGFALGMARLARLMSKLFAQGRSAPPTTRISATGCLRNR